MDNQVISPAVQQPLQIDEDATKETEQMVKESLINYLITFKQFFSEFIVTSLRRLLLCVFFLSTFELHFLSFT